VMDEDAEHGQPSQHIDLRNCEGSPAFDTSFVQRDSSCPGP
jgi:hypothetical protein